MMDAPTTNERTTRTRSPRVELNGAVQLGIALIVVGGVLLADNFGWLDASALLRDWWPVLVILAGVSWILTGARWIGTAAILVGLLLLANVQDVIEADIGSLIFPSLLVLMGVTLLNASAKVRTAQGADGGPLRFASVRSGPGDRGWPAGDLAATAIFGDTRLVVGDGGRDLEAELDRITVTALSVFGEVKVDVPAGWRVENHTTTLFGDVKVPSDQPSYAEAPVVELHGLALFGDAKVRYLDAPEGGR